MNEKTKLYIMYASAVVAVLSFGYLCWRIGCLHDNGAGAVPAGTELGNAQQTASSITAGAGEAERTADEARQTARNIESIISDSGDAIKDCQRILEGIRVRGPQKN